MNLLNKIASDFFAEVDENAQNKALEDIAKGNADNLTAFCTEVEKVFGKVGDFSMDMTLGDLANVLQKNETLFFDSPALNELVAYLRNEYPIYWSSLFTNAVNNYSLFNHLGSKLSSWGKAKLGDDFAETLVEGYIFFVTEVNRAQVEYEMSGSYKHSSYQEVFEATYNNHDFMSLYHWGVFMTTFAWEHHLGLYDFFCKSFVPLLKNTDGNILDLGCGSGVWGLLTLDGLREWNATGIDISATTVEQTRAMAGLNGFGTRTEYIESDALTFAKDDFTYDAGISCFLLEHLENPKALFENMYNNVKPGAPVFITAALTAAEVDHIFEFRYESEVVLMAEKAGFRVLATHSASPNNYRQKYKFLPRSMGMVLQKKKGEIW